MSDENNQVEHGKELSRLYRILSAVHIAAVDYVRGAGKDKDAAGKRAKEVADFFQLLLKKDGRMFEANAENAPRMAFLMQAGDCSDSNQCWDPITEECVDC